MPLRDGLCFFAVLGRQLPHIKASDGGSVCVCLPAKWVLFYSFGHLLTLWAGGRGERWGGGPRERKDVSRHARGFKYTTELHRLLSHDTNFQIYISSTALAGVPCMIQIFSSWSILKKRDRIIHHRKNTIIRDTATKTTDEMKVILAKCSHRQHMAKKRRRKKPNKKPDEQK